MTNNGFQNSDGKGPNHKCNPGGLYSDCCRKPVRPERNNEISHETSKTVDIHDQFDNMHFQVRFFTTTTQAIDFRLRESYVVQVLSLVGLERKSRKYQIVFEKKDIFIREEAMGLFNEKVEQYNSLIKSQKFDINDINLYKEAIGYKIIDPDCCLNCRYCANTYDGTHIVCKNHDNYVFFQNMLQDSSINIEPKVSPCGICKNYERRRIDQEKIFPPIPRSIRMMMSRDIETKVNQKVTDLEMGIIEANSGDAEHID